ncbi:site-specific recombinase XerD [Gottschalkia purinilytica]|uniref:Site-specific recombinase XerD n=1 Tax=Gottschalkia purinilytica TaxID=1503 RepID=A0A0L0WEJ2_GOTPU|nr:site-specific integrase [Gottschalkia purinilytica]KNF09856.1 site-specific recombinase XerD [Gottschalkia purinilytica]
MQYNITYREKDKGIQFIISYKDHAGKWRQKSKQGFTKKKDAKKAADEMLDELKKNFELQMTSNAEYQGITFGDFVSMNIEHEKLYKERNTIIGYKTVFKKFSRLHDIPLKKINFSHIQSCIDEMVQADYKISTIKTYIQKLKTFLNWAVDPYKIIKENPVTNIKIPEYKKEDQIKALNRQDLEKLLSKVKPNNDYMITLIAATCGLRLGEILGLTWNDIDFKNSTLSVNKQWKILKDNTYGFGDLKTKNSNRVVPIPPKTLKELKKYQNESVTDINNRLFLNKQTSSTSVKLNYKYSRNGYNISVHDLRHTYATLLVANGVDFKTAAQLLGHSVEMTMKIYSHVTDDMLKRTTQIVNNVF